MKDYAGYFRCKPEFVFSTIGFARGKVRMSFGFNCCHQVAGLVEVLRLSILHARETGENIHIIMSKNK
jgi:hypothetical protein